MSTSRKLALHCLATPDRTLSPAAWPKVSLTDLKWSISKTMQEKSKRCRCASAKGPAALIDECPPRQHAGQRIAGGMLAQLQLVHGKIGKILQDRDVAVAEFARRVIDRADTADVVAVTASQRHAGIEADMGIVSDHGIVGETGILGRVGDDQRLFGKDGFVITGFGGAKGNRRRGALCRADRCVLRWLL